MRTAILLCSALTWWACGSAEVAAPPKIVHFTATPSRLPAGGGEVTLAWVVTGAVTVSDREVGGLTPADAGNRKVTVTADKSFVLTATNPSGSVEATVRVTVEAAAPAVSITPASRMFIAGSSGGTFDATVVGATGTVRWTLSGPGTIAPDTGPSVIYTPPPTAVGSETATLTAAVDGTPHSATASVSVASTGLTDGVLFYKADGSAELETLSATGALTAVKHFEPGQLPVGATHFVRPYDLYELFYSAADGSGSLGTFDGAGRYRALRTYAPADLPPGQTHLVGLSDRLVMYAAGTAMCGSYGSASYDYTIEKTLPTFATNWSVIVPVSAGLLFYRPLGVGALGVFNANCQWAQVTTYSGFSPDWTTIVDTRGGAFFYRKTDGGGALVTISPDGTPTQVGTFLPPTLQANWDQVISTGTGVLFYSRDGSGELGSLSGNSWATQRSFVAGELPVGADLVAAVGSR
jgi:hypothetical protein